MRYLLVIIMLSIISCGSNDAGDFYHERIVPTFTDDEDVVREPPVEKLNTIIDDFLYDCGVTYGADVSDINKLEYARFGDPATEERPNTVGSCWRWEENNDDLNKLQIIVKEMENEWDMKGLMYHELGHCVLNLDHTEGDHQTIMSPNMSQSHYYEENWDELVEELCTSKSKGKL